MARAKKISKATGNEHMELEAAMTELSKQTDALLAEVKPEKVRKPDLPQRKIIPHNKGASLDIVGHAPSSIQRSTHAPSVDLKEELLPEHAGLSFNEKPTAIKSEPIVLKSIVGVQKEVKTGPEVVVNHRARESGSMAFAGTENISVVDADSETSESVTVKHETAITPNLSVEPVQQKVSPKAGVLEPAKEGNSNSVDQGDLDSVENTATLNGEHINNMMTMVEEPYNHSDEIGEDGIVKLDDDPKEKTDVFDVEEYQSELHDWSKLASNSHWPSVVLLLLLVLVCGIMYLYFTNNLPKIL